MNKRVLFPVCLFVFALYLILFWNEGINWHGRRTTRAQQGAAFPRSRLADQDEIRSIDLADTNSIRAKEILCRCIGILSGGERECGRDKIRFNTVKHCITESGHGFFQIVPNSTIQHVAAIVRINGPIINTMLFKLSSASRSNESVWISNYSSCVPGNYTAAVHIYLQDDGPLSVMLGNSCLDPLFESPFVFTWTERTAGIPCPHLWYWSHGVSNRALSRYNPGKALHNRTALAGLRSTVPHFPFSADGADGRPAGLVCLFGDSQLRNLLNGVGRRMNASACDLEAMQRVAGSCKVARNGAGADSFLRILSASGAVLARGRFGHHPPPCHGLGYQDTLRRILSPFPPAQPFRSPAAGPRQSGRFQPAWPSHFGCPSQRPSEFRFGCDAPGANPPRIPPGRTLRSGDPLAPPAR
jgi:hypothetical protein